MNKINVDMIFNKIENHNFIRYGCWVGGSKLKIEKNIMIFQRGLKGGKNLIIIKIINIFLFN